MCPSMGRLVCNTPSTISVGGPARILYASLNVLLPARPYIAHLHICPMIGLLVRILLSTPNHGGPTRVFCASLYPMVGPLICRTSLVCSIPPPLYIVCFPEFPSTSLHVYCTLPCISYNRPAGPYLTFHTESWWAHPYIPHFLECSMTGPHLCSIPPPLCHGGPIRILHASLNALGRAHPYISHFLIYSVIGPLVHNTVSWRACPYFVYFPICPMMGLLVYSTLAPTIS